MKYFSKNNSSSRQHQISGWFTDLRCVYTGDKCIVVQYARSNCMFCPACNVAVNAVLWNCLMMYFKINKQPHHWFWELGIITMNTNHLDDCQLPIHLFYIVHSLFSCLNYMKNLLDCFMAQNREAIFFQHKKSKAFSVCVKVF